MVICTYLEIINFYIFTKGCFKYMFCLLFVFGLLICTVLCFYLNEIKVNGDTRIQVAFPRILPHT